MIITTMVSRRQSVRTSIATVCCKDLPSNYIKRYRNKYLCFYLIASGGISSIQDIEKLAEAGIPAVIFGKAIYEGKIQLKDLIRFT